MVPSALLVSAVAICVLQVAFGIPQAATPSRKTADVSSRSPGPTFPTPPFNAHQYPMIPVKASNSDEWLSGLVNISDMEVRYGATFNPAQQYMESALDSSLEGIIGYGSNTGIVHIVSYVAVGGAGAKNVVARVYPKSEADNIQEYYGWNGASFQKGAAIETGGYYWYRKEVVWTGKTDDPSRVFFAKDYNKPQGTAPVPFHMFGYTWMYYGAVTSATCESHGMKSIFSNEQCRSAFSALGWEATWSTTGMSHYNDVVDGCSFRDGHSMFTNANKACKVGSPTPHWIPHVNGKATCQCSEFQPCACYQ